MTEPARRPTQAQLKMLSLLEKEGLSDPERIHVLGEIVKGAEVWGIAKRWLIQAGAAIGTFGVLATAVFAIRDWLSSGGGK